MEYFKESPAGHSLYQEAASSWDFNACYKVCGCGLWAIS